MAKPPNTDNFGPPTKATPPFPQQGSVMARQVPQAQPKPKAPPPPARSRHKTPAGRTKHQ